MNDRAESFERGLALDLVVRAVRVGVETESVLEDGVEWVGS